LSPDFFRFPWAGRGFFEKRVHSRLIGFPGLTFALRAPASSANDQRIRRIGCRRKKKQKGPRSGDPRESNARPKSPSGLPDPNKPRRESGFFFFGPRLTDSKSPFKGRMENDGPTNDNPTAKTAARALWATLVTPFRNGGNSNEVQPAAGARPANLLQSGPRVGRVDPLDGI